MKRIISIRSYGVKIGSTGNRFVITSKGSERQMVPASDISEILLYGRAINITTSAIMLAVRNQIPVFFMNRYGRPYSMISPIVATGTILTKRAQYSAVNDKRGFELARAFVYGKMKNQERLLRLRANTQPPSTAPQIRKYADGIAGLTDTLLALEYGIGMDARARMMEIEAEAAREYYWKGFALLLPDGFTFTKREHRHARDPVNVLLNYGYGFLLTRVVNAIVISGLDMHAGFLHKDRAGRESLALDLIEEFRQPVVDLTVLKLLRLKELKRDEILEVDDGHDARLGKVALQKIINALKERLEQKVNMHSMEDWMVEQARNVARFLKGEVSEYRPFIM
ncbi:MAG: CRISPR-associated endonuclease Cas1 [Candidatus Nitrosocaldus sp.]|nr:CRISPR-associated endonuclease Cas1 [Candidatus Nitrosocaldus sp.]MCS7141716.1 CRISPR-associated endonuclease Cas1 [Candidatus Nitrosocaldus sp.]MDW8000796.1 CRISPR-associated endonuclease Cas1 [Candidatus Nitrosocaldus sp.]MDW8276353.1 CRISPR-associated endonuclease Cas1 [Candidatus Nitrosocaldus sp.]